MSRYLALLRGVNVGGKNRLLMSDLASLLVESGCTEVKTFIQSGNAVFTAQRSVASRIPAAVTKQIADRFGMQIPVVMRSAEELREVIDRNPFLQTGELADTLHVYFLADVPVPEDASKLDLSRSHPDRYILQNREVYLQLPNGMARTKLTNAYFDSKLKTTSTARNWRTVLKLYEMVRA